MADYFSETVQKLAVAKIENPRLETRLLFAEVLKCKPSEIYAGIKLSEEDTVKINALVQQRLRHKPLDKILGHREFYKYDFMVNEDVLSPRPDTEILLEVALEILQNLPQANILDLGCGSGCIIESLLKENPEARGVAVDKSDKALAVAKKNAVNLEIGTCLRFIKADWFTDDFASALNDKFDMIVSNPPYIPSEDIEALEPEVKDYDPLMALDGGKTGFESYMRIAEIAPELLNDNGFILLEAGAGQAQKIAGIFTAHGFNLSKIVDDLSGIARCVILQKAVAENKKS